MKTAFFILLSGYIGMIVWAFNHDKKSKQISYTEFIQVDQMNCNPALKGYSKRQLSKLTDEDKFLAKDAVECGIIYQNVRIRKNRIRAYAPFFSIEMWRNDEDANDPGAPLHVRQINIEDCQIGTGGPGEETKFTVIASTCDKLDKELQ